MDKYEFNIKTEQIKKLIRKKDYQKAVEIADTLDFTKIKNNALLITIADVYEVIGQYDSARDVLEIAYERSQLGRQIAFRLTRVSVKRKDLESAIDYYEDFKAIAPKDASCYILQYEISKLKNEPIENQIAILEKYVEDDMDDKWTYELAKLNHDAGNVDRCVELCDTIILWFSEGKYVDKAMELKMLHAPLTKSQQEKYNKRWEEQSEHINVEDIKLKEVNVDNKYDTYNIQAEIAKSMVELFGEPENDNEEESENIPDDSDSFFKPPVEEKTQNNLDENTETDVKEGKEENLQNDMEEDIPEDEPFVKQVIPEDDKTKVIPNIAVVKELAKAAGLAGASVGESIKSQKAVATTETQHSDAPEENPLDDQIEGQITLDELLNGMYKPEDEILDEELEVVDDVVEKEEELGEEIEISEEDSNEENEDMGNINNEDFSNTRELALDALEEILEAHLADSSDEDALEESVVSEKTDDEDISEEDIEDTEEEAETLETVEEAEEEETETSETVEEAETSETVEAAEETKEESKEEVQDESASEKAEENKKSPVDVKTLIRAFIEKYSGVEGLDKQVIKVLQNMLKNNEETNDFVYIMGDVKSGKTTLAMEIIKLMSKIREKGTKKIAKVNGTSFTEKNVDTFASKLGQCDVIIERAASIDPFVFSELLQNLETDEIKRIVIFEDERTLSEKYMVENKEVAGKIDNVIKLKHNKIRDWAKIAVDYAESKGYTIDEMGMLALHAKIDQLYTITLVIHKNHVEQLVDLAIENAERKTIGHLIKKLFGNKDKEKILTESDFMD